MVADTVLEGSPNASALDQALEERDAILQVSLPYLALDDASIISASDVETFIENGVSPYAVEKSLGTLDEVLAKARDYAVGKIPHSSTAIAALGGDVVGLLNSTIELGVKAGVTATGDAALFRLATRASGVAGAVLFAGDLLWTLAKGVGPDAQTELPTVEVEDPTGEVRGTVVDGDLHVLAEEFYAAEGEGATGGDVDTLADLAHKQRAGAVPVGETDYVQQAQDLRNDLRDWLESHGTDGADAAYAQALVAELDFATGA